jgi:hypothetical protein
MINGSGRYLTLALAEVGPGPFTMIIEVENKGFNDFRGQIDAGTQVSFANNSLSIGELVIRTDQYVCWESFVDWSKFSRFTDHAWLSNLEHFVRANAPISSLAWLLFENYTNPYIDMARKGWLQLQYGLENHSIARVLEGVNHLAGLGIGLTPAGDDFLMGVIYGLWMNFNPSLANEWSLQVHRVAASQTTSLSAFWLEVAAEGQASKPWHDLFRAIYDMNQEDIRWSANSLGDYGHTSGYDALAGFLLASTSLMKANNIFD